MPLNVNLYQHIMNNGLQITSPAVDTGRDVTNSLTSLESALNNPLLESAGINTSTLANARSMVTGATGSVSGNVSKMAQQAQNAIQMSSMAQQVNQLDALANQVPSSCANTTELFGSLQGEADAAFAILSDGASQMMGAINEFLAGVISASQLETVLAAASVLIGDAERELTELLAKELAKAAELLEKIKASSLAQSITALWANPCSKAVMNDVLPADVKAVLSW